MATFVFLKDTAHVKNEAIYFAKKCVEGIGQLHTRATVVELKKLTHFTTLFHFLSRGKPMIEYKPVKDLFVQLKPPNILKKYWSNNFGWEMAKVLCCILEGRTKELVSLTNFISITSNKVITMDN